MVKLFQVLLLSGLFICNLVFAEEAIYFPDSASEAVFYSDTPYFKDIMDGSAEVADSYSEATYFNDLLRGLTGAADSYSDATYFYNLMNGSAGVDTSFGNITYVDDTLSELDSTAPSLDK